MPLNPSLGNMYPFVTHHWTPIRGACPHRCSYCYVPSTRAAKAYEGPLRLVEKELKTDLGADNFIFVGSMVDMWAQPIPYEWIVRVTDHCAKFPKNRYLFQSKDPGRFCPKEYLPKNVLWAATIESDIWHKQVVCEAPVPSARAEVLMNLSQTHGRKVMVSIEPVMDFNLGFFSAIIREIGPEFVSIGADSKGHNLPEPPAGKVLELIAELEKFTKVIQKDNLRRIVG